VHQLGITKALECLHIRLGFKELYIFEKNRDYQESGVEIFKIRTQPTIAQYKSLFEFGLLSLVLIYRKSETFDIV
jgi:hypothetical protein